MGTCDLCGRESELYRARVEETLLSVCKACSSYGKVMIQPSKPLKAVTRPKKPEPVESVVQNCGELVRMAREKKGMSQKEFSRKINEKESVLHHIETGRFIPPVQLGRKIELALGIRLVTVEKDEEEPEKADRRSDTFTLGDFIKVRR